MDIINLVMVFLELLPSDNLILVFHLQSAGVYVITNGLVYRDTPREYTQPLFTNVAKATNHNGTKYEKKLMTYLSEDFHVV